MSATRAVLILSSLLFALAGCREEPAPEPGAQRPAETLQLLAQRLRANDVAGFATVALPSELHARIEAGWRAGRTRWPLEELPLDERLPQLLATLSAPGAQAGLLAGFDRQFARSGGELREAAVSLGLFAVQYLRSEGDYSQAERDHYIQAVQALSRWGASAPLEDRRRAQQFIASLTAAARRTGIDEADDFARLGMAASLARLGPFLGTAKQALKPYGLDLDASLAGVQAELMEQRGDTARVRLRYPLGGDTVDTVVPMRRVDGRWYVDAFLRDAQASLPAQPATGAIVAGPIRTRTEAGSP